MKLDSNIADRKSHFAALVVVALIVGTPVAWGEQPEQDQDQMAFVRGAKAWADNCNRCHNMREPKEFRDDHWRPIVYHMRIRAGLSGQETRDILRFLQESN